MNHRALLEWKASKMQDTKPMEVAQQSADEKQNCTKICENRSMKQSDTTEFAYFQRERERTRTRKLEYSKIVALGPFGPI